MTDWRGLCAEVLAFNNGEGCYNFSGLKTCDRDNAAFDAWQDIRQRLKSALAQPEPEGLTQVEAVALYSEVMAVHDCQSLGEMAEHFARAVLARWGRPAIKPVPVSERLPGPDDCDEKGRCWAWNPEAFWWDLCQLKFIKMNAKFIKMNANDPFTHWLPHWALPVPTPHLRTETPPQSPACP
jgi:hypothetical protein